MSLNLESETSKIVAIKRIVPVYVCLGFVEATTTAGERRYVIQRQDGVIQILRANQLHGIAYLLSLYPDSGYWRSRHPKRSRAGVDIQHAMSHLIQTCHAAGLWQG